jgi:hypothetical protein
VEDYPLSIDSVLSTHGLRSVPLVCGGRSKVVFCLQLVKGLSVLPKQLAQVLMYELWLVSSLRQSRDLLSARMQGCIAAFVVHVRSSAQHFSSTQLAPSHRSAADCDAAVFSLGQIIVCDGVFKYRTK